MADPVTVGATAAVRGTLAGIGSFQTNRSLTRAARDIREQAEISGVSILRQQREQRVDVARRRAEIEGRLRVALGETGASTFAALRRFNEIEASESREAIDFNTMMGLRQTRNQARAQIRQLRSQVRSPLLDIFSGALGGVAEGVGLSQAFRSGEDQ